MMTSRRYLALGLLTFTVLPALATGVRAQTTGELIEDQRRAADLRANTVAMIGSPEDRKAYTTAVTDQDRRQAFLVAIARQLSTQIEPQAVEQPRDARSTRQRSRLGRLFRPGTPAPVFSSGRGLNIDLESYDRLAESRRAALSRFIAAQSGAIDGATFLTASPAEQTRLALAAARRWTAQVAWPNRLFLYMSDIADGAAILKVIREVLGESSEELKEWDSHVSPRWRGEVYRRALIQQIDDGLSYIREGVVPAWMAESLRHDGDLGSPIVPAPKQDKTRVALEAMQREAVNAAREERRLRDVASVFGAKATEGFSARSEADRDRLVVLASLYSIAGLIELMQP